MSAVLTALMTALRDLREPRVLALGLLPPLAALSVWIGVAWGFSGDWQQWITGWIARTDWLAWVRDWGLSPFFVWTTGLAALGLLLPVMLIVALLVTDLFAMPVIVPLVGERCYPRLEKLKGGTVAGSAWNAVVAIAGFAGLWIVTLPLWFTGVGALLLPPLLSAGFNQRMFRYDALAEHASAAEYRDFLRGSRGGLFLLGLLLSLLLYVPLVNLLVPVLSGLAFTHYCLGELSRLRQLKSAG